ncbi:hypothetical protein H4R34_000776 [Dimargaris verticillata]|uniref:Uncharacterized protein n=1 Tax=Dimargaris verticillata TaxID=2761393 RepID=A0A9W8B4S5_9FUNG|nr:hypothetical protein H4R34_000776 [Dimargaris verticillata]
MKFAFAFAFLALAAVAVAREALPNNTDTDVPAAGGKPTAGSVGNTVSLNTADADPTDELDLGSAPKIADKSSVEKITEKSEKSEEKSRSDKSDKSDKTEDSKA